MKMVKNALLWIVGITIAVILVLMTIDAVITQDVYEGSLVALFSFVNTIWICIYIVMVRIIKEKEDRIAWLEFHNSKLNSELDYYEQEGGEKLDDEEALQALEEMEEV
jgi:hypothetical protein